MKPLIGRIRGFANQEKSQIDRSEAPSRSKFIARRLAVDRRSDIWSRSHDTAVARLLRPDPAHDGGSFGDGFRGWRAAPDRDATARGARDGSRRHRAANAIDGCVDRPSRVRLPSGTQTQSRPHPLASRLASPARRVNLRAAQLRSFADTRVFLSRRPPRTDEKTTGGGGPGVTHEGLTLHEPGMFHKGWAYGLGGLTWFWIFYRFYKDGDTLIYGHAPHFEHDDDDHH